MTGPNRHELALLKEKISTPPQVLGMPSKGPEDIAASNGKVVRRVPEAIR